MAGTLNLTRAGSMLSSGAKWSGRKNMKNSIRISALSLVGAFGFAGLANATATSNAPANQVASSAVTQAAASAVASAVAGGTASAAGSIGTGGGAITTGGGVQSSQGGPLWSIGQTGLAAAAASRGIGLWAQGAYTRAESSFNKGTNNDTRFKGDIWAGVVGADYRLTQRLVVGAGVGYQNVDINTTFNAGKLKQTGWGVTPYAVFAINQTFFIDVSGGYWMLENEMARNSNTAKATYDGTRWNLGGNLNGGWSINRWRVSAAVGYLYIDAKDDAFRETGTAASAAQQSSVTTRIGQGRAGGTVGYSFGNVTPYASARVEHNFEQPKQVVNTGAGIQPAANRTGYRVGGGLNFNLSPAVSGNLAANTLLGKEDYTEYGFGGTIRVAF
jgi:outer membrane autotransporter protein